MSDFKIIGNSAPIVGKEEIYSVNSLLPNFLPNQIFANADKNIFEKPVKWEVYVLENGRWRKTKENDKTGNKVSYTFLQKSLDRKGIRILVRKGEEEARLDVKPQRADEPKIDSIEFLDREGNKPSQPFTYSQMLKARVHCLHMERRTIYATLWEDDAEGAGHSKANEKNKMITLPGTVKNGIADIDFFLNPDFAKIADAIKAKDDSSEGKTHEYYVTAEFLDKTTASSNTNVANPNDKKVTAPKVPQNKQTPAQKKGPSKKQTKESSNGNGVYDWFENTFKIKPIIFPNSKPPTNNTPLKVGEVDKPPVLKTEGILAAYFAKEEFTLETSEVAGQHEYKFQSVNNSINKDIIALIIKKRVDALVKADKKYAKLDDIKNALTKSSYRIGDPVSFNLCKLGANFIKINSAPLEEEVYVVAKTFLLDGKEVSIKIKEKDSILVETDADVTVLEAKEGGSDITILKAIVEDGIAKVKIKLRPKADEDLKTWKEKLLKGKKDVGYSYKFKNITTITDVNKKKFAAIILNNAKEGKQGNTKLENGKTAFVDDVEKALASKTYDVGNDIFFDTYKTQAENFWLKAECQGDSINHEGEFLKREGEYFVIGKKCECEARIRAFLRMLRVGEGTGELIKSYDYNKKETIYITHDFQKGYTTAFGGNEIVNLDDHPRKNYGGSSAAGAYQVMQDTWDDLQFIKKKIQYNIDSFSKENQDKFSVLLMKHHPGCSDLLQILLNGQTENSIRGRGSRIWASLPEKGDNSRYLFKGVPQPVTPMKKVLEHYEKFLKKELAGESPLHLKNGFLNDFNIQCNCGNTEAKNHKKGYDIDKAVSYVITNAKTIKPYGDCALYVRKAINAGGINGSWGDAWQYITALPTLGFTELGKITDFEKGDIVVFNKTGSRKWGHISMWTGSQWVSDFKQDSIIVHTDYNGKDYHIFRWQ